MQNKEQLKSLADHKINPVKQTMKKQTRSVPLIQIIEYEPRRHPAQRRIRAINMKKSELKQGASDIHKKMPDINELNELCYELTKKSNPIWGKINKTQEKLEIALRKLNAFSKEIESFLLKYGLLINPKTRDSFQHSKEEAANSIKLISFLLQQIDAKRLPKPNKPQKKQLLQQANAAELAALLARIQK